MGRLPPILSSAALVSKSENTNCNSLTVWPPQWLAWRAGTLPTVWHHSVEFHGLYASHFNFVSEHGCVCVVSIPFLGRNMQSNFLQLMDEWTPLPSCACATSKLFQASGLHSRIALVGTGCLRTSNYHLTSLSSPPGPKSGQRRSCHETGDRWRSVWRAARKVSPGEAGEAARQRGTANRLMSRAILG